MFMGINKGGLHPKVVTLTWPHWSWKDTLISMALKVVQWTEKVVSTTDRLPRAWEIPGYSYHYEEISSRGRNFWWNYSSFNESKNLKGGSKLLDY